MATTLENKVSEAAKTILGIPGFSQKLYERMPVSDAVSTDPQCAEEYIWRRLETLGIYKDEESESLLMSPDCAEGDARRVFCENGEPNLPIVRFKRIWNILKGDQSAKPAEPEPVTSDVKEAIQAIRPIDNWSDEELVKAYKPDCPENVVEELSRRAKARAFVIFQNEGENSVDIPATLRMIKEARKRETPVHWKAQDCLKRVFKAGDWPNQVYEECPLHPGTLLLDGYCDECGHSWEGVNLLERQFVRVIHDEGEAPKDGPGIRQLIATARIHFLDQKGLSNDYPKVHIKFCELKAEGKLPSLKSRLATSTGKQDPFASGKRY